MRIEAPWTVDQVINAERWQRSAAFHPYTCPNRSWHPHEEFYGDRGVLRPTVQGWVCAYCDYKQDWAHDFTLNTEPPQPQFKNAYPWWTHRCRSVLAAGRYAGTRCEQSRWHFGPHRVGFDMSGLIWDDEDAI